MLLQYWVRYTAHIHEHTYAKHPMGSSWHNIKKMHLNYIANREGIESDKIYYFDDAERILGGQRRKV